MLSSSITKGLQGFSCLEIAVQEDGCACAYCRTHDVIPSVYLLHESDIVMPGDDRSVHAVMLSLEN